MASLQCGLSQPLYNNPSPGFKIADLSFDSDLLEDARNNVNKIIEENPNLKDAKGEKLKELLYLFERDVALKTLMAG